MARIVVTEPGWPMHDWQPTDIVVDAIVMAVQGCSGDDDNTRVAVITEEGRELRILGVRAAADCRRAEIIVSEEEVGG
jgi:hypothetical protein